MRRWRGRKADGTDYVILQNVHENGRHRAADRAGAAVVVDIEMIAHSLAPFPFLRVLFFAKSRIKKRQFLKIALCTFL